MVAVFVILVVLLILAAIGCLTADRAPSRDERLRYEEQLAAWRVYQLVSEAQREMRAAARDRLR